MLRRLIAVLASLAGLGFAAIAADAAMPSSFNGQLQWDGAEAIAVRGDHPRVDVEAPTCTGTFVARMTLGGHHASGECRDGTWFGATSWPGHPGEIHVQLTDTAGTVGEMTFVIHHMPAPAPQCAREHGRLAFLLCRWGQNWLMQVR